MPRYKVTAPDGKSVMVEGDKPPTDSDLDEIFARMASRQAVVAPAIRGAMERNAQANAMGPGGDPRLSAAQNVNMERATDAGLAMAPIAGAVVGGPLIGAGLRAVGAGAAANPATTAALASGAVGLAQGHGLKGAAMDAAGTYAGGRTLGALLGGAAKFIGRFAAPATSAVSAEAPAVKQTVGALMKKGLPEGPEAMKAVADHIIEWRTKFKMSGPQIVNALREQYGIASKEGNVIARQVIASLKD